MAGRPLNRLTARTILSARPGIYEDGGGLRLTVDQHGKRYSVRLSINGQRVHKGLGSANNVTLADARTKAAEFRVGACNGRDLAAERKAGRRTGKSFRDAFEAFFEVKVTSLSNIKHAAQWRSTMETYVFPTLGRRPVADIDPSEIVVVLRPIWQDKPETATRVLQRMEAVFKSAILLGDRKRASPTTGVAQHLGPQMRPVGSHAAVPYAAVPELVSKLHLQATLQPMTKLGLEFLILTAARSGEVRGARWDEINLAQNLWTIPASRLKTRRRRHQPAAGAAASRP
jgi:integrase